MDYAICALPTDHGGGVAEQGKQALGLHPRNRSALAEQNWERGRKGELCARKREAGSKPSKLEVKSMGLIQSEHI